MLAHAPEGPASGRDRLQGPRTYNMQVDFREDDNLTSIPRRARLGSIVGVCEAQGTHGCGGEEAVWRRGGRLVRRPVGVWGYRGTSLIRNRPRR